MQRAATLQTRRAYIATRFVARHVVAWTGARETIRRGLLCGARLDEQVPRALAGGAVWRDESTGA